MRINGVCFSEESGQTDINSIPLVFVGNKRLFGIIKRNKKKISGIEEMK
jgi:hypothetical protein